MKLETIEQLIIKKLKQCKTLDELEKVNDSLFDTLEHYYYENEHRIKRGDISNEQNIQI